MEGFVSELCKGFHLLADPEKGLITSGSLRTNSAFLGMDGAKKRQRPCLEKVTLMEMELSMRLSSVS